MGELGAGVELEGLGQVGLRGEARDVEGLAAAEDGGGGGELGVVTTGGWVRRRRRRGVGRAAALSRRWASRPLCQWPCLSMPMGTTS